MLSCDGIEKEDMVSFDFVVDPTSCVGAAKTLAGVGPVALLGTFANSRSFGEFKITELSEHAPSFARVGENKEESCSDGQNSSSARILRGKPGLA